MQFSWYLWLRDMGICPNVISPHVETDMEEQRRWEQFFKDRNYQKL